MSIQLRLPLHLTATVTSTAPHGGPDGAYSNYADAGSATGTQTTASTVAWALHIMSVRDDIQDRAYTEIRDVLGGRPLAVEDIGRLDYLRRLLSG